MARIISICNQKGGVGKTTTVINLSSFLARQKLRVLLIDLDPQGNATSSMGVDKDGLEKSIYDALVTDKAFETDIIQKTKTENLFIAPSALPLTGAEVELVGVLAREQRLKKYMEEIESEFDFILIDCPPSLGLLTVNALTASHSALIPIQCEYFALEGLSQLLNTLTLVKENLNSDLEIEGILLTMADFRTNLTSEVIKEVKSYFEQHRHWSKRMQNVVYKAVIPRNIKLTEAPGFAKSIFDYDNASIGAIKYDEMGKEFLLNYSSGATIPAKASREVAGETTASSAPHDRDKMTTPINVPVISDKPSS